MLKCEVCMPVHSDSIGCIPEAKFCKCVCLRLVGTSMSEFDWRVDMFMFSLVSWGWLVIWSVGRSVGQSVSWLVGFWVGAILALKTYPISQLRR